MAHPNRSKRQTKSTDPPPPQKMSPLSCWPRLSHCPVMLLVDGHTLWSCGNTVLLCLWSCCSMRHWSCLWQYCRISMLLWSCGPVALWACILMAILVLSDCSAVLLSCGRFILRSYQLSCWPTAVLPYRVSAFKPALFKKGGLGF